MNRSKRWTMWIMWTILGAVILSLCLSFPGQVWAKGLLNNPFAPQPTPEQRLERQLEQQLEQKLTDLFHQGFQAVQQGNFAAAQTYWTEAIALDSTNPAAWSNRGNVYLSQFELDAALADFNQAISLAPNLADAYLNRGIVWEALKQWEQAIADDDRAIALSPEDAVAYNNRGNAKGGQGDWAGAAADYKTAMELAPGLAGVGVNYGLALYQLGEEAEATRLLKNLVRKYSQYADPRAALTAVLWGQGLRGEAESNWYPVVGLDPRYKDLEWLETVRRWPPKVTAALGDFFKVR